MSNITKDSKLLFSYIGLPSGIAGRGGALRFFLLVHGIPFDEKVIAFPDAWPAEKQRLLETNENPAGTVPVVYAEGKCLPQHAAIARFLASLYNRTAGSAYGDYLQDMVTNEYISFRDTWVHMTFVASDEEKAKYKSEGVPAELAKFNTYYEHFASHDVYMSVDVNNGKPLWGDSFLFGLLRDHILTGHMAREDLTKYAKLDGLFQAYEKLPEAAAWIASNK